MSAETIMRGAIATVGEKLIVNPTPWQAPRYAPGSKDAYDRSAL
jgi:hypothetical protein